MAEIEYHIGKGQTTAGAVENLEGTFPKDKIKFGGSLEFACELHRRGIDLVVTGDYHRDAIDALESAWTKYSEAYHTGSYTVRLLSPREMLTANAVTYLARCQLKDKPLPVLPSVQPGPCTGVRASGACAAGSKGGKATARF